MQMVASAEGGGLVAAVLRRLEAEQERWFSGGAEGLKDPASFTTIQLAEIAQDGSEGLQDTAETLAEALKCRPEDVVPAVRGKVAYLSPPPSPLSYFPSSLCLPGTLGLKLHAGHWKATSRLRLMSALHRPRQLILPFLIYWRS